MALQNVEANITLDLYNHDTTPATVKAIQLDSQTRYVAAMLQSMGAQYDIDSGATVQLIVIRPDKVGVQITGTTFTYGDEGAQFLGPYAELTQVALAVNGKMRGQFKITSGDQILRTEIFAISNGEALDASTDEWADEYDGYNLEEMASSIETNTADIATLEADVSQIKEDFNDIKSGLNEISDVTGLSANILDPTLLPTGDTGQGVTITRGNSVLIFNGGGSYTQNLYGSHIPVEPSTTYTLKAYADQTKRISFILRLYDASNRQLAQYAYNAASDLNSPKTFQTTSETTYAIVGVGGVAGITYSDDTYRISINKGNTNERYEEYGSIKTAVDSVARNAVNTLSENVDGIGEEVDAKIADISEKSSNILNPEYLGTGTVSTVVVSREEDVVKYNGTAPSTNSLDGECFDVMEGATYTATVFTKSTKDINSMVRFYNASGTDLGYVMLRNTSVPYNSINTHHTFTVPAGAVRMRWRIGVIMDIAYDNEEYQFELVEGDSAPSRYEKYGGISAVDTVARANIAEIVDALDVPCYVSPTGSDSNLGTETNPFATIQHAIDEGYKRIFLASGEYKDQTVNISGKNGIKIICNTPNTENNLLESHARQAKAKIDNSIDVTGLEAYNSIFRTALTVDTESSFYKVFVGKTLDPVYSGSAYYGRITTYNAILWEMGGNILDCSRLKPVLSVSACEAEQGTFTYDGTYLYINPTDGSITGKIYKRLNMDSNAVNTSGFYLNNCTDVTIEGVDVLFFPYYGLRAVRCSNLKVNNCDFGFTSYGSASQWEGSNAVVRHCTAMRAGTDGFGITTCGNCSFYDCNGIGCYDDGISHHDGAEGVIDGGMWTDCLKGGVVPSFGSKVTVKNVVCKNNLYGIWYTQSGDRVTDGTQIMQNCLAFDNSEKDIAVSAYNVISHGCSYKTKLVNNNGVLAEYGNNVLS